MKLGLGSYTFRWSIGFRGVYPEIPMAPADVLSVAANHDLSLVQFADNIPLDHLSTQELDKLKTAADDYGIEIELGTQSFNDSEIKQYLQIAQRLDAGILRVALDGPDAEKPVSELARAFDALIPVASAANVRLAIENHFNFPSKRLRDLLKMLNSEHVGACLDVANSICAGEWPMETVDILAPYTINLHLKDYVIEPDPFGVGFRIVGCPLGQGKTDCRAVLDALPKDDNINVILEHWLPHSDDMIRVCDAEHEWLHEHVSYARQTLNL